MRKATLALVVALALPLTAARCGGPSPSTKDPCGVIVDSLKDVQGKRLSDTQRIDRHYQRGLGAGCWK